MTHYNNILMHLKKHGSITSWEAIQTYGCTRLSHYIYLLRNDGYKINSITETGINRFGNKTNYNRYFLVEENKNG